MVWVNVVWVNVVGTFGGTHWFGASGMNCFHCTSQPKGQKDFRRERVGKSSFRS